MTYNETKALLVVSFVRSIETQMYLRLLTRDVCVFREELFLCLLLLCQFCSEEKNCEASHNKRLVNEER